MLVRGGFIRLVYLLLVTIEIYIKPENRHTPVSTSFFPWA